MQDEEFTYEPHELERLREVLSAERLTSYLQLASGDLRQAIALYERNTSLSEAMYGLLQGLEIPLRNAMHRALSTGLGHEDWYDAFPWQMAQHEQIENAKAGLQKKSRAVTPGRMVSELTFGFWVGLTGPKYSVGLWEKHFGAMFRQWQNCAGDRLVPVTDFAHGLERRCGLRNDPVDFLGE